MIKIRSHTGKYTRCHVILNKNMNEINYSIMEACYNTKHITSTYVPGWFKLQMSYKISNYAIAIDACYLTCLYNFFELFKLKSNNLF